MTLTEEQRAALKRVAAYMDEMYSVASPYHGCTEDVNLLRAMIDSSGTVEPTGGFDLERARGLRDFLQDDCAEVGDVWGEMIAEIERLRANEKSLSAILDRQVQEQAARIKSLKKEIRRLKHESKVEQEFTNSYIKRLHDAEARIKELGSSLDEAEALTKKNAELMNGYLGRIAELEDALVEGLTNFLHYRASCYDPARRCPYAKECDDCSTWDACGHVEKFRSEARQLLQAEGKIGPDADAKPREGLYGKYRISKADGSPVDPNADYFVLRLDTDPVARRAAREYSYMTVDRKLALELQERITKYNPKMMDCINLQFFGVEKPRSWQITDERKATLSASLKVLERLKKNNTDTDHSYLDRGITVLRAMLTEAGL